MTVSKDHVIKRQGKEFILYVGLLAEAHEQGLVGIKTTLLQIPTAENGHVAIVHATAEMKDGKTFDGIGDADLVNVGPNIKPHIIRMAETRAKARAMRDATNIGITAFEELGGDDEAEAPKRPVQHADEPPTGPGITDDGRTYEFFPPADAAPKTEFPKASPHKPANANQLATVAKLSRLLGHPEEPDENWTSAQASDRITALSAEYNAKNGKRST